MHRDTVKAKLERWCEFAEHLTRARTARQRICDEADGVSTRHLLPGEIDDVTKKAACRCAENMQNAQLSLGHRWLHRHGGTPF
jgi:hypothetical protein